MSNQRTVDNSAQRLAALKQCTTLDQFVPLRASLTGGEIALKQFDRTTNTWEPLSYLELNDRIVEWRKALAGLGLTRGARVSILLNNSVDHVLADQAVLANAMIPVPLHAIDTPGSLSFILGDSGAECLITNKYERWLAIEAVREKLPALKTVILTDEVTPAKQKRGDPKIYGVDDFLALGHGVDQLPEGPAPEDLAAIVYTSGTTGKPKGVMLTHNNVVSNVIATLEHIAPAPQPGYVFLSFLPLSHTFERTAGYYLPLGMGCTIVFNRSIMLLSEDFRIVHPDVLISVPRIYERIYARILDRLGKQSAIARALFNTCVDVGWRRFCKANRLPVTATSLSWLDPIVWPILKHLVANKVALQFGGKLKVAIAGGAALNHKVARMFCGLGIPPIQGYGMTEASPIIAGNSLTLNQPDTVGRTFPNVELRLAPDTNEIQIRAPSVMKGYWNREEDTRRAFTEDGWLRTGDQADLSDGGRIRIKGRIKEIIVTSVGEKVSPVDLEFAILEDPLFDQVMVVGENRPYVAALVVLNNERWRALCADLQVNPDDPSTRGSREVRNTILKRVRSATKFFPRYGQPRNVAVLPDNWTTENGLLTTTMKLRRRQIAERYAAEIEELYKGHGA